MKIIKLVFLLLLSFTVSKAQVSVFGKVDHIKPDGIDTVGGITLTVSGSTAPYTYTWNPGAISTKDISNKTAGQYTVNVKSASSQTYTGIYRIGYKVEWTNLNRATFRNDTLSSTVDNATSISSSVSKNTLPANTNGWFEFVIPALYGTYGSYYIGFTSSISSLPNTTNDIYGIFYWGQTQDIYSQEGATSTLLSANPKVGDVIRVEKVADTIFYRINNVQVRKKVVTGLSALAMKLKANLKTTCKLADVGCSFINFGNSQINNYVETGAAIIHSSGPGVANGKITVKPKYGGTNTYTWSPSLKTGNTLDSLTPGQYTVTAMDSLLNKSQFTFNVGNKVNWTNLYKASVRNDTLSSNAPSAGFYGSAISKNTLGPNTDGWFEFAVTALYATNRDYYIGFTDSIGPDPANQDYIDNGMYYWSQVKFLFAKENATETNVDNNPNVYDIVRVQRVGNVISYMINGVSVRTLTVTGVSQKRLKIWAMLGPTVQLINVGASFNKIDSAGFTNYVKVTPVVKHSSGPGINNGSVKVTPTLPLANTYSWSPTGATTNTLGSLGYGQYKVTVKDSLANASSYYYNVGYKTQWTNLDYCNVYGDSLVSYITSNYYASASSKNTLRAGENGWMEFPIEKITGQSYNIGFLDSLSPVMGSNNDIDYGINFNNTNKMLYYFENGASAVLYKNPIPGDFVRVERIGNTIYYKVNNVTLRSLTVAGLSSRTLKVKASIQNADYLARVGCSFYRTDSTGFKNFIGINRTIRHSSGQGVADASASIDPKIAGTYTYSWSPGGATTNSITGILAGTYTTIIKDSDKNTTPNDCNVGYKAKWTNLSQCFFRNDTLKGTGANNTYYGDAYSKNVLSAGQNGWVEYIVKSYPANATYIGFTDSASASVTTLTELSYGFNIPAFSRAINYYEGGSSSLLFSYLRPGDVLRLERSGNNIYYKINGAIIRTVTGASIGAKVLKLKARVQYNSDLVNVGCSFIQAKLNGKIAKEHANGNDKASGIVSVSGTGGLAPYRYSWTEVADSSAVLTGLNPGTYHVRITDARNDTVTIPVTIGYRNDWRLQKDISVSGNTYTNTRALSDSASTLVSVNTVLPNKNGWTELTVNDSTKNMVFGFLGFSGAGLDTSYSASWVKDAAINSALAYADSLAYNRFAGSSKQVSAAFAGLHLVRFYNGVVEPAFSGYTSASSMYYAPGDVFRMERTGNYISLYKNNVSIATETVSSAPQQLLSALFVTTGSSDAIALGGNTSDTTANYATSGSRTMAPCDDSGLNWVYSKSFDEYGVVKSESKVYMDLLGRTIQSQSKLITENNVLVSEPLYDSFGRAVGQTLPAPVFKPGLCYVSGFIEESDGHAYTFDHFDNVPGIHATGYSNTGTDAYNQPGDVNNPIPVSSDAIGRLGWYYSDNNDEESLVAADAYPYSRVDFYNDPMGRTKRSGGVGLNHKMGSGHENKIIYTSTPANTSDPVQNELNFIFPHRTYELEKDFSVNTAVPADINKNLQLYKTITLDPDGKDQIVYTNSAGQTIATCITGDGTGCVSHTQVHELYNPQAAAPKKIYIPKGGNTSLKLYELTGSTKTYNNLAPVLKDAFSGITLVPSVHYTYNSSTGAVTFLGDYLDKSIYLEVNYNIVTSGYHFPANTTVNATVDVDYTQWSAYFYDRKGRLLANVAPKDMACQTVPYSVQRTIARATRMTQSGQGRLTSIGGGFMAQPESHYPRLTFELNSEALADTSKMAVLNLNFAIDTIFTMVVDTNLFALFAQKPNLYDSLYLATHPFVPTYADTISPAPLDSNQLFSNVLDTTTLAIQNYGGSLRDEYYRRIDSLYLASPALSLVGKSIRYNGYFRVQAWSSDSVSVNLGDSIPFTYDVEALAYDTLSGGVVCKVTGYQYGLGTDPHALPGHLLPDIPPNTHTITVAPTFTLMVKDRDPEASSGGTSPGTGTQDPPTGNDPGAGVLAGHAALSGGILVVPTVPDPIPVHFANTYMYDEFDRLIGSTSEDEGHVDYVYDQKEDKLLFTQNDKQRANGGKFNCVVYDALGRVSQSGEYDAAAGTYQFQTYDQYYKHPVAVASGKTSVGVAALNNYSTYNDGHILDATHVEYDLPDPSFPSSAISTGYVQCYTAAKVSKTWNDHTTTWYSYDELGRLSASVQNSAELGNKSMVSFYNFRGKLTASAYQYQKSDQFYQLYQYDADERLKKSSYGFTFGSLFNGTTLPTAEYSYYLHGPLKRAVLGGNLQGLDFVYTIGGMLKSVNNPIGTTTLDDPGLDGYAYGPNLSMSPDAFGFSLQYYDNDYVRTGSPIRSNSYTGAFGGSNVSYAGLIKNSIWRTAMPAAAPASYGDALMYEYNYDRLGQLSQAQFGTVTQGIGATQSFTQRGEYKVDNLTYDLNGNIQTLRRYAETVSGSTHLLDELTYNYHSSLKNRLLQVADASTNPGGYSAAFDLPNQSNSNNYVYNEIGELVQNKQENQGFEYNASGLTKRVYKLSTGATIASFTYNDKGLRHSKISYDDLGMAVKGYYYSYDAEGALVATYTQNLELAGEPVVLKDYSLYGAGRLGTYNAASSQVLYELTDHLGNVRAVVTKNNSTNLAEVLSYTDYYPHGGVMPGRNYVNSLSIPYSYQGIEKDAETNLLNFELRQFDARLGRWQSPDPMGEFHSPYLAMGNNPVSVTDPTGGYTSDQFWNSTDAPRIGAYSDLNIGTPDLRDGAQINEQPVADPSKNSYMFMTPAERRNVMAMNGTSYEHQAAEIMLGLGTVGGWTAPDGRVYHLKDNKWGTYESSVYIQQDPSFRADVMRTRTVTEFIIAQTVSLYILHGSSKSWGGLSGGHVGVGIGDDVYGFTNTMHGGHIIGRMTMSKRNSKFEKDDPNASDSRFNINTGGNMTVFEIPVSNQVYNDLKNGYEKNVANTKYMPDHPKGKNYNTPYDYAQIFGKRCASSAYSMLVNSGALPNRRALNGILSANPGTLYRYSKSIGLPSRTNYQSRDYKTNSYSPNGIDKIFNGLFGN